MERALLDKANSIADSVKSTMAGAFAIHSPSRWMRDMIGVNMMRGWIDGMDSMRRAVINVSEKATDWMTPDLPSISMAYDTPSGVRSSLASAINGTVDVNSRDEVIAGAIASLERKLTNLTIIMNEREVARATSGEMNR